MGFPEALTRLVRGLYRGISSQVLVNGHLTGSFPVRSGVRQGCPLSPLAFVCVMEPFLRHVRADKVVRGLSIPGSNGDSVKTLAYMDDVAFVAGSSMELQRCNLLLGIFCAVSGMAVNWGKSAVCSLGRDTPVTVAGLAVVPEVKILGVTFDRGNRGASSYRAVFEKVERKLTVWKLRRLSLSGKVLVIKAVILPLLLYTGLVFPPGKRWTDRVTRLLFLFFWGSKMERCAREKVRKQPSCGGCGLPDLEVFLSLHQWLHARRVSQSSSRPGCMLRYLGGWLFSRWGWCEFDARRPFSFKVPAVYLRLRLFWDRFRLAEVQGEELSKRALVRRTRLPETPNVARGLSSPQAEITWPRLRWKGLPRRHADVTWMALLGCLPTRAFLRGRGLNMSEQCPRPGCAGAEDLQHLFLDCPFSRNFRSRLWAFMCGVTGASGLPDLFFLTGWWALGGSSLRPAWLLSVAYRAVLWELRNLFIFKRLAVSEQDAVKVFLSHIYGVFLLDCRQHGRGEAERQWQIQAWPGWVGAGRVPQGIG